MIKELYSLLELEQKRNLFKLQIMIILMSIFELIGIASIGPFMALVSNPNLVDTNDTLNYIYNFVGASSKNNFIFLSGILVLFSLSISSLFSILTTWRLARFSIGFGISLGNKLYDYYLKQNWIFHTTTTSAILTKQISTETNRVTSQILAQIMSANAKLVLVFFISISLIIYNPLVAIGGLFIFVVGYFIIYKIVKKRLTRYSKKISSSATTRFRLMNEGFGGVKDILLSNRQENFIKKFKECGDTQAKAQAFISAVGQTPRYLMELLAFGSMILLVLVLLKQHGGVIEEVIPVLAVYALAGFKLLPALQQIYSSITSIKGASASFELIKTDLLKVKNIKNKNVEKIESLDDFKEIKLENITFSYPNKKKPAIENIDLIIKKNTTIGLVGETGSGKSTTVDIILALLSPTNGFLKIDDTIIKDSNTKYWQKNIGYVPQAIFLSEGTISENIAFGIDNLDIDIEKVKKAVKLAHLEELVASLEDGLDTKVGERGVQLSGGQRQRIGIARALYNDAKVLVFDEATSALDGITEKIIMDAINELSGDRTIIIIAHRLTTVMKADVIYMFDKGKIIDSGNFEELLNKNERFKEMVKST